MTSFWALAVVRDDLSRTALTEGAVPEIGDGERSPSGLEQALPSDPDPARSR